MFLYFNTNFCGSIPFTRSKTLKNLSADISLIAHCDWSKDAAKRWMCVAIRTDTRWQILPPEPVGESGTLLDRLAGRRHAPGAVLAGFDFSIGLPQAYAGVAGIDDFRSFLGDLGSGTWPDWFLVATTPDEIGIHRPFYPARPGGALRCHLLNGLGLHGPDELLRLCERSSAERGAGASLFWTMGGNQVGKASISGWREVIIPNLSRIGLWPFDGSLQDLAASKQFVLAETYPGDVYARLGFPRRGWSKRRHEDRAALAHLFRTWLQGQADIDARAVLSSIETGFGQDGNGEDRFDALVGLLGMIDVVMGQRSDGAPDSTVVTRLEGWILGHKRAV